MRDSVLVTGVDKLVSLVSQRGSLSLKDAVKELGVGEDVITEWGEYLENEGIIGIEYKFSMPYFVKRKLSKKEAVSKAKDFNLSKDSVLRKAEGILLSINMETEGFKRLKNEFINLRSEMEDDLAYVKDEMKEFEKYSDFKNNLNKKMLEDQEEFKKRLKDIDREVQRKHNDYKEILTNIDAEIKQLSLRESKAKTLEGQETALKKKIEDFIEHAKDLKKELQSEEADSKELEKKIHGIVSKVEKIRGTINKDYEKLVKPLEDRSQEYKDKISLLQKNVLQKVTERNKEVFDNIDKSKQAVERFKKFFDNKLKLANMLEKIEKDKSDLEKDIKVLIGKAKAFHLTVESGNFKGEAQELEKTLKEIEEKKNLFEKTLQMFTSSLKKRE